MKRLIFIIALATCLLFPVACLKRTPYEPIRYYSITESEASPEKASTTSKRSLAVRRIQSASSIEERIMKRVSEVEVTYLDYNRWSRSPHEAVTAVLVSGLEDAALFRAVYSLEESPREADSYVLSGSLERFEWDAAASPATARIELRLLLRGPGREAALWSREISVSRPVDGDAPESFARAMNEALVEVVRLAAGDVDKALQ